MTNGYQFHRYFPPVGKNIFYCLESGLEKHSLYRIYVLYAAMQHMVP